MEKFTIKPVFAPSGFNLLTTDSPFRHQLAAFEDEFRFRHVNDRDRFFQFGDSPFFLLEMSFVPTNGNEFSTKAFGFVEFDEKFERPRSAFFAPCFDRAFTDAFGTFAGRFASTPFLPAQ